MNANQKEHTINTNNKAQHTPGPWKVGRVPLRLEVDESPIPVIYTHDGGLEIAQVRTSAPEPGEREANARLIAAAPELLETLRYVYSLVDGGNTLSPYALHEKKDDETILDQIRAAIAKAEGQ